MRNESNTLLGEMAVANYPAVFGRGEGAEPGVRGDGMFWCNSKVKPRDVVDGLSSTFMIGERSSNLGQTTWFGFPLEASILPGLAEPEEAPVMALGHTGDPDEGVHTPNDPLAHVDDFWSYHDAGCNFLMADGSVQFISISIDARVYAGHATRAGGENTK